VYTRCTIGTYFKSFLIHLYVHVYHGIRVRTRIPWYTCTYVRTYYGHSWSTMMVAIPRCEVVFETPWYHGTRVPYGSVPWYQWYHGTMVPYGHVYSYICTCTIPVVPVVRTWYVRTTYVLVMLCHNFLIGKGHTCALRTTCVLGGYTASECRATHTYTLATALTSLPRWRGLPRESPLQVHVVLSVHVCPFPIRKL
jgi:hypothetical protein